jgi:membrane protein YqaA with SNARE-associated domain
MAWLLSLAASRAGATVLVVMALLEATVFPGPTEAVLIALTLARRERAWWYASLATAASVTGGVIGYHLGATLFDDVARPLLASYDMLDQVDTLSRVFRENALLALVSSGYTPIPYMLYTMMAGAFGLSLPMFIVGSMIGRALKFVPIAAVAYVFGPAVHRMLRRVGWWGLAAVVVVVVVYLLLRGAGAPG